MFRRMVPAMNRHGFGAPARNRGRDPFDLVESLMNDIPFEVFGGGQQFPAINVKDDDGRIEVQAELPGMNKDDLDISVQNSHLVIQGEKKFDDEQDKESYHVVERSYGQFYRAVPLPEGADQENIKASFKDGVLSVQVPKPEKDGGKKIEIETS